MDKNKAIIIIILIFVVLLGLFLLSGSYNSGETIDSGSINLLTALILF